MRSMKRWSVLAFAAALTLPVAGEAERGKPQTKACDQPISDSVPDRFRVNPDIVFVIEKGNKGLTTRDLRDAIDNWKNDCRFLGAGAIPRLRHANEKKTTDETYHWTVRAGDVEQPKDPRLKTCGQADYETRTITVDIKQCPNQPTWDTKVHTLTHEMGHVLGLADVTDPKDACWGTIMSSRRGPTNGRDVIAREVCYAARNALEASEDRPDDPDPPGGDIDGRPGGNPDGGGDGGGNGGDNGVDNLMTDRCIDFPRTPGCPENCELNPDDPRCGQVKTCGWFQQPDGTYVADSDNGAECPDTPPI